MCAFTWNELLYLQREWVLLHGVCHVSTVALNRHTKHWLWRGPFAIFYIFFSSLQSFFYMLGSEG